MKRNLRLLTILAFLILGVGVSNASDQNCFKVFKTDGTMDVIFFEKLDSIVYSQLDLDDVLHDDIRTQEIHTADSLYRYSVDEIDSISFQRLPTVYKDGVVKVEGELRDYVIRSESLNLFLRSDCPEYLLPVPGDNICTLECDEVLPYGFIGTVKSIEQGDGEIMVECSAASLTDVFDSVEITSSATSAQPNAPSRAPGDLIWPPRQFNMTLPSIKGSVSLTDVNKAGNLSAEYDMNTYLELNTEEFEVNVALMVRPGLFVPGIYFSYTSTARHNLSIGASLSSSTVYEHEFPVEQIRNIRIPGVPVVELFEEGGIFLSLSGSFGLKGTYTKPFKTITHFTFDNKKPTSIPPTFKVIGEESQLETTLEGELKAAIGLYLKIGCGALAKEAANVAVDFKVGPEFSTAIDLTTATTPISVRNTDMYDMMNRDDYFRADIMASASVSADLWGDTKLKGTVEIGDLFVKNPIYKRGVVPEFKNTKLEGNGTSGSLDASVSLYRKLMFPTRVGLALYDESDKLVDSWWSPDQYKDKEGMSIYHQFKNLDLSKEYVVHPLTYAYSDEMVSNPMAIYKAGPILYTGVASDITSNSATITGNITNLNQGSDCEYGILLDGTEYIPAYNITSDGNFQVEIANLLPRTQHIFCTYLRLDGKTQLSKKWGQFETEYSTDGDFDFLAVSSVRFENILGKPFTFHLNVGGLWSKEERTCYIEYYPINNSNLKKEVNFKFGPNPPFNGYDIDLTELYAGENIIKFYTYDDEGICHTLYATKRYVVHKYPLVKNICRLSPYEIRHHNDEYYGRVANDDIILGTTSEDMYDYSLFKVEFELLENPLQTSTNYNYKWYLSLNGTSNYTAYGYGADTGNVWYCDMSRRNYNLDFDTYVSSIKVDNPDEFAVRYDEYDVSDINLHGESYSSPVDYRLFDYNESPAIKGLYWENSYSFPKVIGYDNHRTDLIWMELSGHIYFADAEYFVETISSNNMNLQLEKMNNPARGEFPYHIKFYSTDDSNSYILMRICARLIDGTVIKSSEMIKVTYLLDSTDSTWKHICEIIE